MNVDRKHRLVSLDVQRKSRPNSQYTDVMRSYWEYLNKGFSNNPDVDYAVVLFNGGIRKAIMDALLIGSADPKDILTVFEVSEAATAAYKELFFDVGAFVTRLDRIAFLDRMKDDPVAHEMAKRAYALGPEFIYFTYGNFIPSTDEQRALVKKLYMVSAYKAMESAFNSSASKVSAAARDYAKLMLKAYETIEALLSDDPDAGMNFVKVLIQKDMEVSMQLSGASPGPVIYGTDIV